MEISWDGYRSHFKKSIVLVTLGEVEMPMNSYEQMQAFYRGIEKMNRDYLGSGLDSFYKSIECLQRSPNLFNTFDEINRVNNIFAQTIGMSFSVFREHTSPVLRQMQSYHSSFASLAKNTQHIGSQMVGSIGANPHWLKASTAISEPLVATYAISTIASALCAGLSRSHLAGFGKIAGLDWDSIGSRVCLDESGIRNIQRGLIGYSRRYNSYLQSIVEKPSTMFQINPDIPLGLTRNFLATTDVIVSISRDCHEEDSLMTEITEDLQFEVEELVVECLHELHPKLATMWTGMTQNISSTHHDSSRHFLISGRELMDHFLRTIAPNDQIMNLPNPTPYLTDDGNKPSRTGRVLFLYRAENSKDLDGIALKDFRLLQILLRELQRVHQLDLYLDQIKRRSIATKIGTFVLEMMYAWQRNLQI